jgi:hypothetical protein
LSTPPPRAAQIEETRETADPRRFRKPRAGKVFAEVLEI